MEIVELQTQDGLRLYGGFWEAPQKAKTVVIHIHGMTDFFYEGNLVHAVRKAAEKQNYAFFAFNNRGAGLVNLLGDGYQGTSFEIFEKCLFDIDTAIDAMRKRGFSRVILSGHSTGCQKSVYYQSKRKNRLIKAVILLSPADDVSFQKKLLNKKFDQALDCIKKLYKEGKKNEIVPSWMMTPMFSVSRYWNIFKPNSVEGNILNYAKDLKMVSTITVPVLAIMGSEEQYAAIPPQDMLKKLQSVLKNKQSSTTLLKGGDHSYHGKETSLQNAITHWLNLLEGF